MFRKRLFIFCIFVGCMMGLVPSLYAQSNSERLIQVTMTPTPILTSTITNTPTISPAITATVTPTETLTPAPTLSPTITATATPTETLTPAPTLSPTITATETLTPTPTLSPTMSVTVEPTLFTTPPPTQGCDTATLIPADFTQHLHSLDQNEQWFQINTITETDYLVEGYTVPGTDLDLSIEMYQDCQQSPPYDSQQYPFTPHIRLSYYAQSAGMLYIKVKSHSSGGDYYLSIRPLTDEFNPGAGIVVAGHGALDPWQTQTNNLAVGFYQYLTAHAYRDDDIYLMSTNFTLDPDHDSLPDVDAIAYSGNLELAISSWARRKVSAKKPLVLYIASDDGTDALSLNGGDKVSAEQLNSWLTELESYVPNLSVLIIIESSQSGIFASKLATKSNRMVLSSTNDTPAWGTEEGAFFSDHLLSALQEDLSFSAAFRKTQWAAEIAHPNQQPQVRADGNVIPNEPSDYARLAQLEFMFTGVFSTALWPPLIESAKIAPNTGEIIAHVTDEYRPDQETVWAVIYPITDTTPLTAPHLYSETFPTVPLILQADGTYTGTYPPFSAESSKVVIYAKHQDTLIAQPYLVDTSGSIGLPTAVSTTKNQIESNALKSVSVVFAMLVGAIFLLLTLFGRKSRSSN